MATGTVASPSPNSPKNQTANGQLAKGQVRCDDFIEQKLGHTQWQVKFVDVVSGVMLLGAGTLFFLLAAALLEHWVAGKGLGFGVRLGLWLAWLAAAGTFAWRYVLPPLVRRINPIYAAQTIEHSSPSLKNSLINFLLLRNHREEVVPVVFRAMEQRAAVDLSRVEIETAVDRGRLVRMAYVLAGAVAVFALYLAVSPKNPLVSAMRVLWPWSNLAAPTRVHIDEVRPGDTIAYRGDKLEVSAEVSGLRDGEDAVLQCRTTDDGPNIMPGDQQIVMRRAGEGNRFQCLLPQGAEGLQQDMLYSVMAGDAATPPMKIEVHIPPLVTVDRIDYHFPSYTGRKDFSTANLGDVKAIEGTRVTIHATTNMAIKEASIDLNCSGLRLVHMQPSEAAAERHGCTATGVFVLGFQPGKPDEPLRQTIDTYQVLFTNEQGMKNHAPVRYRVEVERDLPPEIRVLEPKDDDVVVAVDGELKIRVRAQDPDFGLRKVVVQTELQGRPLHSQSLVDVPASKKGLQGSVVREWRFVPRLLGLQAGNVVKLWAEADDNREPLANHVATGQKMIRIVAPGEAPPRQEKRKPDEGNELAKNGQGQPGDQGQSKPGGEGNQQSGQPNQGDNTKNSGKPGDRGTPSGDGSPDSGKSNPSTDTNGSKDGQEPSGTDVNSPSGNSPGKSGSSNNNNVAGDQQEKQRINPDTQEADAVKTISDDLQKPKPNKEQDQLASNEQRNSKKSPQNSPDNKDSGNKDENPKNDNQQDPAQPQTKEPGGNADSGSGKDDSADSGSKKEPNNQPGKADVQKPNQDPQSQDKQQPQGDDKNGAKQGESGQDQGGSGGQPKPQANSQENGGQSGASGSQGGSGKQGSKPNGSKQGRPQSGAQNGGDQSGGQSQDNSSSGKSQGAGGNSQQQPGSNSTAQQSQGPNQSPGQGEQPSGDPKSSNSDNNQSGNANSPDDNALSNGQGGKDASSGRSGQKPGDNKTASSKSKGNSQSTKDDALASADKPAKSKSGSSDAKNKGGENSKDANTANPSDADPSSGDPSSGTKQGNGQPGAKGNRAGEKPGDKNAGDKNAEKSSSRSQGNSGSEGGAPGQKPNEKTSSGDANANAGSGDKGQGSKKPSGARSKDDQLAQTSPKGTQGEKSGSPNGGKAQTDGDKKPGMKDAQQGDNPTDKDAGGDQPKQDAKPAGEDSSNGGKESGDADKPGAQSRSGASSAQQSRANQQSGKSAPSKGGSKDAAANDDKQGQQDSAKSGEHSKQDSSGAPEPQSDKQPGSSDAGKSNPGHAKDGMNQQSGSPQSPGNGNKDGNQDSQTPGDLGNKKGGGGGGGGKSNESGKGLAGQESSAEDGGSPSPEKGNKETGTKAGEDVKSNSKTGSAKTQKTNSGGRETAKESSQQNGSQNSPGGQSKPSSSADKSQAGKSNTPSGQSANGSPTQSGGGSGQPAGSVDNKNHNDVGGAADEKDTGADKVNLEYSKKQLDLALEHLKDQMKKDKSPLLKDLGWSKDDAQHFIDNWRKRMAAAEQTGPQGAQAKHVLDESLRNLGLRPHGTQLKRGQTTTDTSQSVRDAGQSNEPPEWSDALRQYNTATAGQ